MRTAAFSPSAGLLIPRLPQPVSCRSGMQMQLCACKPATASFTRRLSPAKIALRGSSSSSFVAVRSISSSSSWRARPASDPATAAAAESSGGPSVEKTAKGSEALWKKPAQNYTEMFEPPTEVTLKPIGYVRSPYKERFGTPRQATVTQQVAGGGEVDAEIHLEPGLNLDLAVRGLEGFEYIWVISWMHLNKGWNPLVTPPRGPKVKRGVLATRAPHRPNPMALSAVRLVGVEGRVLRVRGIDLLDGTPVLDVKPYVPYCDAFPDARAGWLDEIRGEGYDMKGPDRLDYSPPPPHIS